MFQLVWHFLKRFGSFLQAVRHFLFTWTWQPWCLGVPLRGTIVDCCHANELVRFKISVLCTRLRSKYIRVLNIIVMNVNVANWHMNVYAKFWQFLEVVGVNIFGMAYLSNLACFRIFLSSQLFLAVAIQWVTSERTIFT